MRKLAVVAILIFCQWQACHAQYVGTGGVSVRTNLLFDAVVVPNLGLEWGMGGQWSMLVNGDFIWLSNTSKNRYWRIAAADVELRYWTGSNLMLTGRRGFHLGPYVAAYRYDLEFGGEGQRSDFNWGVGGALGYTVPIGRRFSLDFTLSFGYIDGEYKKYSPGDEGYVWEADYRRRYFGPTKAEVALVWNICSGGGGYGNGSGGRKLRKGGLGW